MTNVLGMLGADRALRRVGIVAICASLYPCIACEAWMSNLNTDAGYFLEVRVGDAVIDASFEAAASAAVVLTIDDQEPTLAAIVCVDESGEKQMWRSGRGELEALDEGLSVVVAANLDECGGESLAVAEIWLEDRVACPSVVEGDVPLAARSEVLFAKQATVAPAQQQCDNSISAIANSTSSRTTEADFVLLEISASDGV